MAVRAGVCVVVIVSLLACAGCTRRFNHRLPGYQPGAAERIRPCPWSGIYKIRWTGDGKHFARIGASERLVLQGEALGFVTRENGRVVAIAGEEHFELANLPPHATLCYWYARGKEQTEFGRAMELAGQAAAVAIVEMSAEMLESAIEDELELDDDDDDNRHPNRKKDRDRGKRPPPYPHSPAPVME